MSVHRNIITNYNQPDATFLEFINFYRQHLKQYVQLCAPDGGQRNRLKHVERL